MEPHPDGSGRLMLDTRPLQALLEEYGPRVTTASGRLGVSAAKPESGPPAARHPAVPAAFTSPEPPRHRRPSRAGRASLSSGSNRQRRSAARRNEPKIRAADRLPERTHRAPRSQTLSGKKQAKNRGRVRKKRAKEEERKSRIPCATGFDNLFVLPSYLFFRLAFALLSRSRTDSEPCEIPGHRFFETCAQIHDGTFRGPQSSRPRMLVAFFAPVN